MIDYSFIRLIEMIAWPVVVLVLGLTFGGRLLKSLADLVPSVRSLSFGGFTLELAAAQAFPMAFEGAVDLRHAGQSTDVNDSTLRSFYEQIADSSRVDYVVVDLGEGREWLSSRLYILSAIMSRMRGLRVVVFVETAGPIRRRFIGFAQCEHLRWKLSAAYPWFEAAYAEAEHQLWQSPNNINSAIKVSNEQGRVEEYGGPEAAATLLRAYLGLIQQPGNVLPDESWVELPSQTSTVERAQWLSARDIEQILGSSLNTSALQVNALQARPAVEQAALIVSEEGQWVALMREDRVFVRLIDRERVLDEVAHRAVASGQ